MDLFHKLCSHPQVSCVTGIQDEKVTLGVLSVPSLTEGLTLPHSSQLSASYNTGLILLLAKKGPRLMGCGGMMVYAMAGP